MASLPRGKVWNADFRHQIFDSWVFSIALSGGGLRAALYGAGVLAALDGRNSSAVSAGTVRLLLQSTLGESFR